MNRRQRRIAGKQGGSAAGGASNVVTGILASAVERFQADALLEAYELSRRALAIDPRHVNALQLAGVIAGKNNDFQSAVTWFEKALEIQEPLAALHFNIAVACRALGRLDEAVTHYQRTVELQPDHLTGYNNLGMLQHDLGRLDEAVATYAKTLALGPRPEVYCNLGKVLQDQGKFSEAIAVYEQACRLAPGFADAHDGLGSALHRQKQPAAAAASFQRAAALRPNDVAILNNLASALLDSGGHSKGLATALRSLAAGHSAAARDMFIACVRNMPLIADATGVREPLRRALEEGWARPDQLAGVAAKVLASSGPVGAGIARVSQAWPRRLDEEELLDAAGLNPIATNRLLRALLEATPVCDIALERWLTAFRSLLLTTALRADPDSAPGGEEMALRCAVAHQCFLNDYVFDVSAEETVSASILFDELDAALACDAPFPASRLVAMASYLPLGTLSAAPRLLDRIWPEPVMSLCVQQVSDPLEEMRLRLEIPQLTSIGSEVSRKVQLQYEENPYPRWSKAAAVQAITNIDEHLAHRFPNASLRRLDKTGDLDILVAGSGTGKQPIEVARQFTGSKILAVDLSLASLAYAKRMTKVLGVEGITYAQADILNLGSLGCRFDIIQASGVLHHMADPWSGWKVLLSLLRPDGFMYVGLYSENARKDVVAARTLIAERGHSVTPADIRSFRTEIADSGVDSPFGYLIRSPDFFSISSCRDLLFHVQEHRVSLPAIASFLAENALSFVGFDIDHEITCSFQEMFPDSSMDDLTNWNEFEAKNPRAFAAMYQFWVQKAKSD
jgi:tetratricopeptide (TPR) repeat protein/2-polyprenyl-3-methyl-5-hydroxy-6-metoxy-1,4-benzoquinol methylase